MMRCGFSTACKLEDVTRALTVRVLAYETIEKTRQTLAKCMTLVI